MTSYTGLLQRDTELVFWTTSGLCLAEARYNEDACDRLRMPCAGRTVAEARGKAKRPFHRLILVALGVLLERMARDKRNTQVGSEADLGRCAD